MLAHLKRHESVDKSDLQKKRPVFASDSQKNEIILRMSRKNIAFLDALASLDSKLSVGQ